MFHTCKPASIFFIAKFLGEEGASTEQWWTGFYYLKAKPMQ